MSAQESIDRLDASLAEHGETVIIRRGGTDVTVLARCKTLKATEIVARGSSSVQMTARGILSPTGLAALLPLRTTDKIVRGGQERAIGWVEHVKFADTTIRINFDFAG